MLGHRRDSLGVETQLDRPRTILIADDEHHIRSVVAQKLRSAGYTVIEVRDGEEALEAALQAVPDLVITDFQMPLLSGLELCASLKAREATRTTPAILLTARGHAVGPDELARTNIRKIVDKPFSAKTLLELVQSMLAVTTDQARAA
jgi:CheY-like chemotaxis protein